MNSNTSKIATNYVSVNNTKINDSKSLKPLQESDDVRCVIRVDNSIFIQ